MSATASTWRRVNKLFIIALASIFLAVGVSVHRDAQANPVFLPLIIGVMFSGLMGVGTAIEMWDGAPDTASVVGAKALSVTIANPADNGAAEGAVRVPTTPSADSAASIAAPSAPGTASSNTTYAVSDSFNPGCAQTGHTSAGSACGAWAGCRGYGAAGTSGGNCGYVLGGTTYYDKPYQTATTCPSGYAGNPCTLTNARLAVDDNKLDLARSGTALSKLESDKANAVNAVLSTLYLSNDSADVSGISVSGQPRMVRTTAKSDGGSEVTQITQKTDGAGNSYLEKRQYVIDPDGIVKSASQSAVPGALEKNGPGTGYAVSGGTGTFTPAAPGSGSGVAGSGTGATDYARQGEAAAAANLLKPLLEYSGTLPTPEKGIADAKALGESLCGGDGCAVSGPLNPGISWMPSLLPGSAVGCEPIPFVGSINVGPANGLNSTFGLDICGQLEIIRMLIGWMLNLFGVVYAFLRIRSSFSGV